MLRVVGFLGVGVSSLCEHRLLCLIPGICLVPHTYLLSFAMKLQWPFGLWHGSEVLQSHWSRGYIIRWHLQHSVLLGFSFRCLMSFLHIFHSVLWLCEFLSFLQVLFLYKCCPSTTALWRTSSPWLETLLQMQGMLGCTSLCCNGCGALWEKRYPAPKGDSLWDILGSGRRCLGSRSPELILLNWFLFIQWKPLRIEVSFPNLNLLTELWITVDICQFW